MDASNMQGVSLGTVFETAVAGLAGVDVASLDPGTVRVDLINPAGPTTVRFTVHIDVDTDALKAAVKAAVDG